MKKRRSTVWHLVYFTPLMLMMFTVPVQAYIDPSVMTYAIQAVAGMAIAIGAVLGIYWRKIRRAFLSKFHLEQKMSRNYESDDLVFHDPVSGEDVKPDLSKAIVKEKTKEEEKPKEKWLKGFIPAVCLSLGLSFLFTVYGPLELYFNNQADFLYDFSAQVPVLAVMFIGFFAVMVIAFAAGRFIFEQLYEVMLAAGAVLFICSWIQGSFLVSHMPPMDGTMIDWGLYARDELVSLILWVIVIVLIALIYRFFERNGFHAFVKGLSALLGMTLFVSLMHMGISTKGFAGKEETAVTFDGQLEMSSEHNAVILVLDAVDGKLFADTVASDNKYSEYFKDFTIYPDTLAAYPFTEYSIPFILSGKWNENTEDFNTFETKAMNESPLFERLEKDGYEVSLYEDSLTYGDEAFKEKVKNIHTAGTMIAHKSTFIKQMVKMIWFKYAPFTMKRTFQPSVFELNSSVTYDDGSIAFNYSDFMWRDYMRSSAVTAAEKKQFKFIHTEGAHVPFDLDEMGNTIPTDSGTYVMKMKGSIELTNEYLQMLKDAGVYDNTAIIIMADHGYNYAQEDSYGPASRRQNALLMAKGFNETNGTVQISEKPVSFDDLQKGYANLLDGHKGNEIFDFVSDERDSRRFLHYVYLEEYHLNEYEWNGRAYDMDAGKATGNVYELQK